MVGHLNAGKRRRWHTRRLRRGLAGHSTNRKASQQSLQQGLEAWRGSWQRCSLSCYWRVCVCVRAPCKGGGQLTEGVDKNNARGVGGNPTTRQDIFGVRLNVASPRDGSCTLTIGAARSTLQRLLHSDDPQHRWRQRKHKLAWYARAVPGGWLLLWCDWLASRVPGPLCIPEAAFRWWSRTASSTNTELAHARCLSSHSARTR